MEKTLALFNEVKQFHSIVIGLNFLRSFFYFLYWVIFFYHYFAINVLIETVYFSFVLRRFLFVDFYWGGYFTGYVLLQLFLKKKGKSVYSLNLKISTSFFIKRTCGLISPFKPLIKFFITDHELLLRCLAILAKLIDSFESTWGNWGATFLGEKDPSSKIITKIINWPQFSFCIIRTGFSMWICCLAGKVWNLVMAGLGEILTCFFIKISSIIVVALGYLTGFLGFWSMKFLFLWLLIAIMEGIMAIYSYINFFLFLFL